MPWNVRFVTWFDFYLSHKGISSVLLIFVQIPWLTSIHVSTGDNLDNLLFVNELTEFQALVKF